MQYRKPSAGLATEGRFRWSLRRAGCAEEALWKIKPEAFMARRENVRARGALLALVSLALASSGTGGCSSSASRPALDLPDWWDPDHPLPVVQSNCMHGIRIGLGIDSVEDLDLRHEGLDGEIEKIKTMLV